MEVLSIDCVISFDAGGVSSHPNHISCFEALQECYSRGAMPTHTEVSSLFRLAQNNWKNFQVFCLDSVSLLRKYTAVLDAPLSLLRSPFCYFASPRHVLAAWRAMRQHWLVVFGAKS